MNNPRPVFLACFALLLVAVAWAVTGIGAVLQSPRRPNVILILADDMGYSDLDCMGSEIHTPNLDKLAQNGLLMTQFYNAGRCCPTRASLLTGLYQHQAGVGDMTQNRGLPAYQGYLNEQCVTLGEALAGAGYETAMAGKWHVGEQPEHWPQRRGFEHVFAVPKGGGLYFYPALIDRQVWENDHPVTPDPATFYSTDAFNDYAVRFIEQSGKEKPFFLYLAHIAPHFPLQAKPADIARYRGKYRAGFEAVRQHRYARMRQLGLLSAGEKLSPADDRVLVWNALSAAERDSLDLKVAVYAAQIDCMDQGIGRIVTKLRETGQLDNTVILFLSDNGGESQAAYPVKGATGPIGTAKSWASYGVSWANVSNTPFRLYKGRVHEGGIITPLIVHCPNLIKAGRRSPQVGHVIDLMPTLLDLAGAAYPAMYQNKPRLPLAGKSLLPVFLGKQGEDERSLFWEHEGNRAVRQGSWKAVSLYPANRWELYDLTSDPTELIDLASQQPDRLRAMERLYGQWAGRVGVVPWQQLMAAKKPAAAEH